jgi:hypothetical protein
MRRSRPNRRPSLSCLVPGNRGALYHDLRRGQLWGKFFTAAPHRLRAIRRAIQNSQASLWELATRYRINPKTVAKWRRRGSVCHARMGPKEPRSTVLSKEEEALIVTFRGHTLLPLDDCLYALQSTIPHLTRSSLHRCLQRHSISRLPETQGDKPAKRKFKSYPIRYFHVDICRSADRGRQAPPVCCDRSDIGMALPERSAQFYDWRVRPNVEWVGKIVKLSFMKITAIMATSLSLTNLWQHNKALSGHFGASNALGTRASIFGARLAEHTTASKISEHC